MRKSFLLSLIFLISLFFLSCKREYKYELWAKTGLFSNLADTKESENIIKADNDSIAFVEANKQFFILMDVKFHSKKEFHPEIYHFKLINADGVDISSGSFLINAEEIKKKHSEVFLSNEFKEYIKNLDE